MPVEREPGDRVRPTKVAVGDLPELRPLAAAPNATFARIITAAEHGANLLFGVCNMPPGEGTDWAGNGWEGMRGYGPSDYVYYVLSGRLRVQWADRSGQTGEEHLLPEEAMYMPPGYRYRATNVGIHIAKFIYTMTPPWLAEESPTSTTYEQLVERGRVP
jgi:mannose-6-phosphate isomerase-like protein (cupin superfamily)